MTLEIYRPAGTNQILSLAGVPTLTTQPQRTIELGDNLNFAATPRGMAQKHNILKWCSQDWFSRLGDVGILTQITAAGSRPQLSRPPEPDRPKTRHVHEIGAHKIWRLARIRSV